jgi:glucose-1-phosphate thymidylyltransferase
MRPHTLTVPKAVDSCSRQAKLCSGWWKISSRSAKRKSQKSLFVIGDFGKETEEKLLAMAKAEGAKGSIHYQGRSPRHGACHSLRPKKRLRIKSLLHFADTLFRADFAMDDEQDGVIWVNRIDDPRAFGV